MKRLFLDWVWVCNSAISGPFHKTNESFQKIETFDGTYLFVYLFDAYFTFFN